jgi:hypothetical protein
MDAGHCIADSEEQKAHVIASAQTLTAPILVHPCWAHSW